MGGLHLWQRCPTAACGGHERRQAIKRLIWPPISYLFFSTTPPPSLCSVLRPLLFFHALRSCSMLLRGGCSCSSKAPYAWKSYASQYTRLDAAVDTTSNRVPDELCVRKHSTRGKLRSVEVRRSDNENHGCCRQRRQKETRGKCASYVSPPGCACGAFWPPRPRGMPARPRPRPRPKCTTLGTVPVSAAMLRRDKPCTTSSACCPSTAAACRSLGGGAPAAPGSASAAMACRPWPFRYCGSGRIWALCRLRIMRSRAAGQHKGSSNARRRPPVAKTVAQAAAPPSQHHHPRPTRQPRLHTRAAVVALTGPPT